MRELLPKESDIKPTVSWSNQESGPGFLERPSTAGINLSHQDLNTAPAW